MLVRLGPDYLENDLVFATALGTPLSPRNVLRTFKRTLAKAGLPPIVRFHDLRHAAATNSLVITADLYTHTVASLEANAAERLAAVLRQAAPAAQP